MKHRSRFNAAVITIMVVTILVFLLWGLLPVFFSFPVRAPVIQTQNNLKGVAVAMLMYCKEHIELPASIEQLSNYAPGATYHDAWGNAIRYVHEAPVVNKQLFDLYSIGKNGRDEYNEKMTGDDIVYELTEFERSKFINALANETDAENGGCSRRTN